MALIIIMIIASCRVFLLQAHRVQQVLHPIQLLHRLIPFVSRLMDVLQSYLQKAFRQHSRLSAYANNSLLLSDIFGQSIRLAFHDAGEIDLTNSTDFMGPELHRL